MIENIRNDLKKAMKNGEKNKINALRNLISRLKSKEIETGSSLNEDISLKICMGAAKQIKDSIEQFKKGNRLDLIEKELCGSGASGRNGGCMIPLTTKFSSMKKIVGEKDAFNMVAASEQAIYKIKDFYL